MTGPLIRFALLALGLAALDVQAFSPLVPEHEYEKRMRGAEQVGALKSDLFGDNVSLYNGATEFSVVDIDLPGNGGLPVQLRRRLKVEPKKTGFPSSGEQFLGGFGWWDLDVPYLSGTFPAGSKWDTGVAAGQPTATNRCSDQWWYPRTPTTPFSLKDIWSGVRMHLPGEGDREVLANIEAGNKRPSDGATYPWSARDFYSFKCKAATANGYPGEGFIAVAPDGTQITFDVGIERAGGTVHKAGHAAYRTKVFLMASQVRDRFGNWVNYTYSGDKLTRISASDGREIVIAWEGDNVILATANGRRWTYDYGSGELASVTLPDSSRWTYSYAGDLWPRYEELDAETLNCPEPEISTVYTDGRQFTLTATHPSGATGTFAFAYRRHHRMGTPSSACVVVIPSSNGNPAVKALGTPDYFDVYSLGSKTITGPALATQQWQYNYEDVGSGRVGVTPCTSCRPDKRVHITQPDGNVIDYSFGTVYMINDGRLLATRTRRPDGSIIKEEVNSYVSDQEAATLPIQQSYGNSFGGDDPVNTNIRPVKSVVISQDGTIPEPDSAGVPATTTFASATNSFDVFARPLSVTKSSSLGYSRTEATAYYDDLSRWVLGQAQSVTCVAPASCANLVISRIDYDPNTALPLRAYSYGRLQQALTYNADGTVASVTDGNNNLTTLSNWKRGIPQLIRYADATMQSATVDDNGWIASIIDANGYVTGYGYDSMGRLANIAYPTGDAVAWNATTQSFAPSAASYYGLPAGYWIQTTATGNGRRMIHFDALWRPVVEESYDSADVANTRSFVVKRYDEQGRLAFQSYPVGTLGSYADAGLKGVATRYDVLGRVVQTTQDSELGPLTTITEYLPDFRTRATDRRGWQTTTRYMAWDQPSMDLPVSIAQPEDAFTDIVRDAFGKPISIRRHNAADTVSLTRSYVYDGHQQLCKSIEPETGSTVMAYDAAGNLAWSANGQDLPSTVACDTGSVPLVQRVTRGYDARNRVINLIFPDNLGNTTTTYASDGLVASLQVDNGAGNAVITDYAYNRRRLLTGERLRLDTIDWSLGHTYNSDGHLAASSYPDGLSVAYAPNGLGQPTRAGDYASGVTYYPNGAISGFTYGNGIVHTMMQNARQLPERSRDGGALDDSYDYDQNGNVLAISDGLPGGRGNRDMSYDGLNRLTATVSPMFAEGTLYSYDALDNLTRVKAPGRDHLYSYDAQWRLQTVNTVGSGTAVIGLGYDARGNLSNKNGRLFAFDTGNRLREAVGVESYQYDGQGRRVKATHPVQGAIYSFYGQDGALRYQRDERQGKATDYVMLGGSLVAQVSEVAVPTVPIVSVPGFVTDGSYTVAWTAVAGASSYELQERGDGGAWSPLYVGPAVSQAITGKAGGVYGYRVRACGSSTCGAWSAEASVSVTLPPEAAPVISLPATALGGNYTVSWTAVAGATGYTLEERVGEGAWSDVYAGEALGQMYAGKAAGDYSYRVKACNAAGCGAYSAVGTVQSIQSPTGTSQLTAPASSSDGSYTVSWTAVAGASSYTLEEQANGGAWTAFGANAGTSQAIGSRSNGSYAYRVKGCNGAGCGPVSAVATTVVLHPPEAPVLTVPASDTTGSYAVSWTVPATATGFQIEESANSGGWTQVYAGSAGSTVVGGRGTGSYGYRGRACNASGCGSYSATQTVSVLVAPATAPVLNVPASTGTGDFTVSWSAVAHATTYLVEELPPGGGWGQLYDGAYVTGIVLQSRLSGVWWYRARACNTSGCSPYSEASVTSTAPAPPATPTGLKTVQQSSMLCRISWNASAGATYYQLKWGSDVNFYQGTQTSMEHDAQCPRPLYVRACNAINCSAWSL